MSYLDKKEGQHLGEYRDILDGKYTSKRQSDRDKNMTLPF